MGHDAQAIDEAVRAAMNGDQSAAARLPEKAGLGDVILNWCQANSLWPLFFGLSCCFVEQATVFTGLYDIARFGAEVLRGSPRQADLMVVSGTVFKKAAPMVKRIYEQMPRPKWVISMGSCANTGGMYDVYSVVQGVDQIIPVDVYVTGCPPRPEALLHGLITLQDMIRQKNRPLRPVLNLEGGHLGGRDDILIPGATKDRDTRGPGMGGIPARGTSVTPPAFAGSRSDDMWTPPAPKFSFTTSHETLRDALAARFGDLVQWQEAVVDMPTVTAPAERLIEVLDFLKREAPVRYERLEDITAVDETARKVRPEQDYTAIYTLTSLSSIEYLRVRVPVGEGLELPSVTPVWPSANWYECEIWDLFGIRFAGHPGLRRLIMPEEWEGHPLRKGDPQRATEIAPYLAEDARREQPEDAVSLLEKANAAPPARREFVLNIGPHHYSTHGLVRFILELYGEEIVDMTTDIGYHHRGVEKIAEHQSWHQFIPYTDRLDYLSGAANNLTYLLAVEKLCGVAVPERAQCVRVMLAEFYRLSNHLLWLGTMVQDLGMITPVFHTFREREQLLDIMEAITGARLHPAWLRIGGLAMDLPDGWDRMVRDFVTVFPDRVAGYRRMITGNPIVRARIKGIGRMSLDDAVDYGISGANLRACGSTRDLRKVAPYSGYEQYDFDIPTSDEGDCLARFEVRFEEMIQSNRIIAQCLEGMPSGRFMADDYRYCIPDKKDTLRDIESLIHHFINATRGPKVPAGEAYAATEAPRGEQGFYVVSDGGNMPYRLHMRSPGYASVQALPLMTIGHTLADFIAIISSLDYIAPDLDR
ncbi:NADH-quinone oxidoreductase subunit B/C/D [uncultured Pseudodesulfovibrio sp.]|uniref:NADH-quinone oxidoreductase subunit B/C/D n=1 Tax=uncultured Pseudodesulfovibrio sp. TaxID=2035858 RepID=UPI002D1E4425|nr:NADH-quinone oxidoreductase subunit B/C/D [uncultured Pseudodesulfovibrio sp.]